jgi:predicted sugar kinase
MKVIVETPSRLHFGLLSWGSTGGRRFGGTGLMIERPGVSIEVEPAADWSGSGVSADRFVAIARGVADRIARIDERTTLRGAHIHVNQSSFEHVGLGFGTQASLAVASALLRIARTNDLPIARTTDLSPNERTTDLSPNAHTKALSPERKKVLSPNELTNALSPNANTKALSPIARTTDISIEKLAAIAGRGRRSGIGVHGFVHGGLIVDGGRKNDDSAGIPPLVARLAFPADWSVLIVIPQTPVGLHGQSEIDAFRRLPPPSDRTIDRLCRLVLLELAPAVAEADFNAFAAALSELERTVGESFAAVQGGVRAHPISDQIARTLENEPVAAFGQSSWGPTLYAFSCANENEKTLIAERIRERFGLGPDRVFWTRASDRGASIHEA